MSDRIEQQDPDQDERVARETLSNFFSVAPEIEEDTVWRRIDGQLSPRRAGLMGQIGGALAGAWDATGRGPRRLALAGIAATVAAVFILPGLFGGSSASAAVLEAVEDLSARTSSALEDDQLTESELIELRELAERLLARVQEDPNALSALSLEDLAVALDALRDIESRLLPTGESTRSTLNPVATVTDETERALQRRDPGHPLLALTDSDEDESRFESLVDLTGPTTYQVRDAGTVTIAPRNGALVVLDATPNAGWAVEVEQAEGREIEVEFRRNAARVRFDAEIEDGAVRVRIRVERSSTATPTATARIDDGAFGDSDDDDNGLSDDDENEDDRDSDDRDDGGDSDDDDRDSSRSSQAIGPADTTQVIPVGGAGTVTMLFTASGIEVLNAQPAAGWSLDEVDEDDEGFEVRFRRGEEHADLKVEIEDGRLDIEVSMHN